MVKERILDSDKTANTREHLENSALDIRKKW